MRREAEKVNRNSEAHVPRFYVDAILAQADSIILGKDQSHHLSKVLRAKIGDKVLLFNGDGHEYSATISDISKATVALAIKNSESVTRESPLQLTLAQGIARGDRMDQAIAKAVELGATAVQPLFCARGKVRLVDERARKKHTHWQRIAISAAEQSGRVQAPRVHAPLNLNDFLQQPLLGLGLVLDPAANASLKDSPRAAQLTLLVGPESGLSSSELKLARKAGYSPLRFGPRILRTETAGLAFLAALQTLWGDLA